MEGTHLLPRSPPLAQPGNLADPIRPLPGKLGKAGRQVADPVCAQGCGRVREQEEFARGVSSLERVSLPVAEFVMDSWRGVRDEALSQVSGIDGCIFVHMSGFIGGTFGSSMLTSHAEDALAGNHNKAGAIEMAKKALSA
jgi:hypothetical protein